MAQALNQYFIQRYVRCGEMPFFLIFCRDKRGWDSYCVILTSLGKLRKMARIRRGFSDPGQFGRILCTGRGSEPNAMIREMLKARYDFDLDAAASEVTLFPMF